MEKIRVISFMSRSLSKLESKYPAHKLEFLAIKWPVIDKFHGNCFDVCTDNKPLT